MPGSKEPQKQERLRAYRIQTEKVQTRHPIDRVRAAATVLEKIRSLRSSCYEASESRQLEVNPDQQAQPKAAKVSRKLGTEKEGRRRASQSLLRHK